VGFWAQYKLTFIGSHPCALTASGHASDASITTSDDTSDDEFAAKLQDLNNYPSTQKKTVGGASAYTYTCYKRGLNCVSFTRVNAQLLELNAQVYHSLSAIVGPTFSLCHTLFFYMLYMVTVIWSQIEHPP
jgi:hypothetical protein